MREFDNVVMMTGVLNDIDDFNACTLQFVHDGTGFGGEESKPQVSRYCHHYAERGGDQALVKAPCDFRGAGNTLSGGEASETVEQTDQGSEEAKKGGAMSDGVENAEKTLQPRHLKLSCFLHNFLQLLPRCMVALESSMNDTTRGHARGNALVKSLSKVLAPHQTSQATEKFANIHAGAVKVGEAFEKDGSGEGQGSKQQPDKRAAFGDQFDHGLGKEVVDDFDKGKMKRAEPLISKN